MTFLAIGAALLLQVPAGQPPRDTLRLPPRDTLRFGAPAVTAPAPPRALDSLAFDAPSTRELVGRVSQTMGIIPAGLADYRARMESSVYLSLRADSTIGGELPLTVDEFAGEVSWAREGGLEQRIRGHRIRQLAPTPYTIGSWLESPWVVPHLYGSTVDALQLSPNNTRRGNLTRAIHPFSIRGPEFYRYTAEDTVRVRTQEGVTTLVAVGVRPRGDAEPGPGLRLLAGTFYLDVDRAAIARARFGFTERSGRLSLTEAGLFFELENALVGGSYWLPVRQRREIQVTSPILGGATALRLVTGLSGFELNRGWRPDSAGSRLVRALARGETAFAGWRDPATRGEDALAIGDFADLREAIRPADPDAGPLRVGFRAERTGHVFRYNRVEGLFLGAGARVEPRDPAERSWDVYGAAGYAFAEGTPRGELSARFHPVPRAGAPQYTLAATGYRRLRDTRVFRPAFEWELGYALGAAFGGTDRRDYYDATGGELFLSRRRGPFIARIGGRGERQDSVTRHTEGGLFGGGSFDLIAPADPGTHTALEAELRYARGAGAFGITPSLVAALWAEAGVGDFRTQRVTATLATRRPGRYVTLIARADAGLVAGEAPPQFLIRFGGGEGLRGYDDREFAGSSAALARGRLLLHLPPYGNRPLFRTGIFLFPPLRPALALSGDVGSSTISEEARPSLLRVGGRTTEGTRYSYGVGLSFFEDAVSVERVWPGDGGEAKWYAGFTTWF
jgi:hypothetical protein